MFTFETDHAICGLCPCQSLQMASDYPVMTGCVRGLRWAVPLILVLTLGGCNAQDEATSPKASASASAISAVVMPDVTGKRLDAAYKVIRDSGFTQKDQIKLEGGGALGVLVESNWEVCQQAPTVGTALTGVPTLTIERECKPATQAQTVTSTPSASRPVSPSAKPAQAAATRTTVDALLDKLNAANLGGIKLGDRFRLTGELFQSDLWGTGATGDYFVLLKAKGGAQDLMVFVKQSDVSGFGDGTVLDLVVENVELTVSGETTDGWLRGVSVRRV